MNRKLHVCEIGGVSTWMTRQQVERWNTGSLTNHDLRTVQVHCAATNRTMTLRRATNPKLEYELANMMWNMSAAIVR